MGEIMKIGCLKLFSVLALMCLASASQALVVLQYHHVSDKTPKATSISPEVFEQHLQYLKAQNYQILAMPKLESMLRKGEKLPDKTAVITFDDGYTSVYAAAYPLLKKYDWPFTVFINTKAHDEKSHLYMSWEQLRTMAKNGATIANHTDSHPHLIRQQGYEEHKAWEDRREQEITFAQKRIEKEIGQNYKIFAYPYGEYDKALQQRLKSLGYIAFGQQSGPIADSDSLQALPRFAFGGNYTDINEFKTKVSSLPFPQARVKVTNNSGKVLDEPELPADVERPVLRIASPMMGYTKHFTCYASGQGKITAEVRSSVAVVRAPKALPVGRSRYNCTASAGQGRFFWYSQMFIRRQADGAWYNE